MKIEDYIHMHNEFARCFGWNPIVRSDAPHEKGKTYRDVKIQPFPFLFSKWLITYWIVKYRLEINLTYIFWIIEKIKNSEFQIYIIVA